MITEQESGILLERVSETNAMLYITIVNLLDTIEYDDYYDEFNYILTTDTISYFDLGLSIRTLLNKHLFIVANRFGIDFTEDSDLNIKVAILSIIISIKDMDIGIVSNVDGLMSIVTEDNVDIFSRIISEVSGIMETEIQNNVHNVEKVLLDNILLMLKGDDVLDTGELLIEVKRNRLLYVLKKNDIMPTIGIKEIIKTVDMDVSIVSYIKWYINELHSENTESLINDIITILIFSKDGRNDFINVYFDKIEPLLNTNVSTIVSNAITDNSIKINKDLNKIKERYEES